jgi:hypothetical protein
VVFSVIGLEREKREKENGGNTSDALFHSHLFARLVDTFPQSWSQLSRRTGTPEARCTYPPTLGFTTSMPVLLSDNCDVHYRVPPPRVQTSFSTHVLSHPPNPLISLRHYRHLDAPHKTILFCSHLISHLLLFLTHLAPKFPDRRWCDDVRPPAVQPSAF